MSLALMLVLQAATVPPTAAPALAAIDFDLARLARFDLGLGPRGCDRTDPSASVNMRPPAAGSYPLEAMAREFEPGGT